MFPAKFDMMFQKSIFGEITKDYDKILFRFMIMLKLI